MTNYLPSASGSAWLRHVRAARPWPPPPRRSGLQVAYPPLITDPGTTRLALASAAKVVGEAGAQELERPFMYAEGEAGVHRARGMLSRA